MFCVSLDSKSHSKMIEISFKYTKVKYLNEIQVLPASDDISLSFDSTFFHYEPNNWVLPDRDIFGIWSFTVDSHQNGHGAFPISKNVGIIIGFCIFVPCFWRFTSFSVGLPTAAHESCSWHMEFCRNVCVGLHHDRCLCYII